jgi:hypothetical protein
MVECSFHPHYTFMASDVSVSFTFISIIVLKFCIVLLIKQHAVKAGTHPEFFIWGGGGGVLTLSIYIICLILKIMV